MSGQEVTNMTEGSSFWREKMSIVFRMLDQTGDGFLQKSDFFNILDRIENSYLQLGRKMGKPRRNGLKFIFIDIMWNTIITAGKGDAPDHQVSKDGFTNSLLSYFSKKEYKDYLNAAILHSAEHLYDILDSDQEGGIGVEKYKYFLQIFGMNCSLPENGFEAVDSDGTGEISKYEFIEAYTDFWMNQDGGSGSFLFGNLGPGATVKTYDRIGMVDHTCTCATDLGVHCMATH